MELPANLHAAVAIDRSMRRLNTFVFDVGATPVSGLQKAGKRVGRA